MKLREAIWKAAGWGPTQCHLCGGDLIRLKGYGSTSTVCSNVKCLPQPYQHYIDVDDP